MLNIEDVLMIKTRIDFNEFIDNFINELQNNLDEIENPSLMMYLEAIGRWLQDFEGLYHNMDWELPRNINWKNIGLILINDTFTNGDFKNKVSVLKNKDELISLLYSFSESATKYTNSNDINSVFYYIKNIKVITRNSDYLNSKNINESEIIWNFLAQIIDAASIYE